MYDHIIVPVDLAHPDPEHEAISVARANLAPNGKLTLLHVISPRPGYLAMEHKEFLPAKAAETALQQLQALVKRNKLPADTELRVEHGRPHRKICELIHDIDRQAIVMSSSNPTYADFLIGSVADQVVKNAECSVFIVRHSALP